MKKIINIKQAIDRIYASGDDSAIKMVTMIQRHLEDFNAGKTGLKTEIVPFYSIADLLRDYGIKVSYAPLRACHVLIYDNQSRTTERYEIILTAKGSVFSSTADNGLKAQGHICELVYGKSVDFYKKGEKYIGTYTQSAINEYKNVLKKQRKYIQVKRLEMLPVTVQQQLAEVVNQ